MVDKNSFDGSLQTKGEFFKSANFESVYDQISEGMSKYVDPISKTILVPYQVERDCLVCGSSSSKPLFKKACFQHVRCKDCGFLFVNPMLKEQVLIEYYSNVSGSWADVTKKEPYTTFQNKYFRFHLDNIEKHIRCSGRNVLDIGCNNGEFLAVARSQGWQVTGHELNHYAVNLARDKGIEVLDGKLSVNTFRGRKFAAITLFGVLEHLPYPDQILEIVKQIIEPGGVLASLVPNIDSLATRMLRERSNTFDGIEHLNFWNKDTYDKFISRCGFKLVHAETGISEIYTMNNYLQFDDPYTPLRQYPLLLPITPEFIHENLLGHHLCCYSVPI